LKTAEFTNAKSFNLEQIRADFPILGRSVNGQPLAYLDNAATAQKPRAMMEAVRKYFSETNANVHRGVHRLSQEATSAYEEGRESVRAWLHAANTKEIIFTKGCTEAINLVAASYGRMALKPGDIVLLSALEHHSNIVPWQMVCEQTGAEIRVIPISDDGEILLDEFNKMLDERVKILALTHVSNALGTVLPIKEMIQAAHRVGAIAVIDGAQAAPHLDVNVQDLDADFYAVSVHKVYGPTGLGVLYGKQPLLEAMPPYQGGGDMIHTVSFEKSTYADLPAKFEAGTPHIVGPVAFRASLEYLGSIDWDAAQAHEENLRQYAEAMLDEELGVRVLGKAKQKLGVVSFVMDNCHPHDIGTFLDADGIAIRTGHHCCMPLMHRLGVPATARASFAFYNTREEVDRLLTGVRRIKEVFA
jgi:cysteine desulfurase / selenocysteine lyase